MHTPSTLSKVISRLALSLALVAATLGPLAVPSRAAPTDVTFTVTTNLDYDPGPANGSCLNGVVEGCGLREAIKEANAASGNKTINFAPGVAGQTIILNGVAAWGGPLYLSGDNITIDGSTSGGDIIIDAGGLSANSNLFEIQGNSNTIRSLMLQGWPDTRSPDDDHGHGVRIHDPSGSGYGSNNTLDYLRIYGFEHNGVLIAGDSGGGGNNNTVAHSLIGAANWASTSCTLGNRGEGIAITNSADNTNINSNTIVCNVYSGIYLAGSVGGAISGTMIQTNMIGTNGSIDMGNGLTGIADWLATDTTIYNNTISGNGNDGVWLRGSVSAEVYANRIGTNSSANAALPNDYDGIILSDGANGNTIGDPDDAGNRNIISGNNGSGVTLASGATNNVLNGNYIGLGGSTGMIVIPNQMAGVAFFDVYDNALGSPTATVNQFISGNLREGVYAQNSGRVIINSPTLIGVAGNGTTPAGNGLEGVRLVSDSTYAMIYPGIVAYNAAAGIAIEGDGSTANDLNPEVIKANVGLPIDLGNDGATANGLTPPGPNNWMNYPTISGIVGRTITGHTCNNCTALIYSAIGDPRGAAGGGTYLAQVTADGSGVFYYAIPVSAANITMIACDTNSNCSEMSPSYAGPIVYAVYLPMVKR